MPAVGLLSEDLRAGWNRRDDRTHIHSRPAPLSEETIEHRYWADFRGVWAAIREHPGFSPHRDILALQQSLEILSDSVDDLATRIEAFDTAARPVLSGTAQRARISMLMFGLSVVQCSPPRPPRSHGAISSAGVGTHCVDAGHPLPDWDVTWGGFQGPRRASICRRPAQLHFARWTCYPELADTSRLR